MDLEENPLARAVVLDALHIDRFVGGLRDI
jgi:hypothetical protein